MKIYIVVNDVTYSRKSVITRVHKAYLEQKNSSKSQKNCWLQFVKSLLNDLGFSHV